MPKISEEKRQERRREIADAARRCFVAKGFEATSMSDIVAESGLSAGALYLHYENKADLVRQVMTDTLAERADELSEIVLKRPAPHPTQVLKALIEAANSRKSAALRIHAWSTGLREPQFIDAFEEFSALRHELLTRYARAWLEESGLSADEAARRAGSIASVLVILFQGYLLQLALSPTDTIDDFVSAVRWLDFAPPAEEVSA